MTKQRVWVRPVPICAAASCMFCGDPARRELLAVPTNVEPRDDDPWRGVCEHAACAAEFKTRNNAWED